MTTEREGLKELALARKRLLLEQKSAILYGVGEDPTTLDPELLFLSVATVHKLLGFEMDELAESCIRHQNATIIAGEGADLILAPRGGGKSTTATQTRCCWYILRNFNIRILVASATEGAAQTIFEPVRLNLENNRDLIEMFGRFRPSPGDVGRKWSNGRITIRQRRRYFGEPTVMCLGIGGQASSRHFDVVLLDDIVTMAQARTRAQRRLLDDWYGSTLTGCLILGSISHHIGTRYYPGDQWDVLIKGRTGQSTGALAHRTLIVKALTTDAAGNEVSYSKRFPVALLHDLRERAGPAHFDAQYQQDTARMEGEVWSYADFQWWDELDPLELARIRQWPVFLYFDLANKKTDVGDYFAGVAMSIAPDKTEIYVRDLVRFRGSTPKQRMAIDSWCKYWQPMVAGVEAIGSQAGFAEEIRDYSLLPVVPRERKHDKVSEGHSVAGLSASGKVFFPLPTDKDGTRPAGDRVAVMIEEMLAFPNGDHDDAVDAYVGCLLQAMFDDWGNEPRGGIAAGDRMGHAN